MKETICGLILLVFFVAMFIVIAMIEAGASLWLSTIMLPIGVIAIITVNILEQ